MAAKRTDLEPARVGYQKTYYVRFRDHLGRNLNLDGYTLTATAVKDDGSTYLTPTIAALSQQDPNMGVAGVTFTAANLAAATTTTPWKLDCFAAVSGGNAEPVVERFQFHVEAKETSA